MQVMRQFLSQNGIMVIYKPDHFKIEEFVPPEVIIERGDLSWELIDPTLVYTWDELRKRIEKPCYINNWEDGGGFRYRGLRPQSFYKDSKNHFSQHTFGKAGDGDVKGLSPKEVIEFIVKEKKKGSFQYLTGIEVGCRWVHLDTRPPLRVDENGLFFFDKNGIVEWGTYQWPD